MDDELPEGIEEKVTLMPVESLLITCPKCNKELECQKRRAAALFDTAINFFSISSRWNYVGESSLCPYNGQLLLPDCEAATCNLHEFEASSIFLTLNFAGTHMPQKRGKR